MSSIIKKWECGITRRFKINRRALDFNDYTDLISEPERLNFTYFGNFLLTCTGDPIITVDGAEIEVIKNEQSDSTT